MLIFLIGYRGSGKTTVARLLAQELDCGWIDADDEIERRAGKSIAGIFADDGEVAFRDLESAVVADLAKQAQQIVALGGGAVMRDENRQAIAAGYVVCLQASPGSLFARINADETTAARRPNLTAAGGIEEIKQVLDQRNPVYQRCADLIIDTEEKSPQQVADEILASFNNMNALD